MMKPTDRESATILAALRFYQGQGGHRAISDEKLAIATDNGRFWPLEDEEIDYLCEKINVADYPPA